MCNPRSPAAAADDLPYAVVGAPDDERPRCPVPQAPEHHGDHDVEGDALLGPVIAAERDVQVVAQPERQRDVPPTPKILEVERRVGPPEVDGEPESHQQGQPDGDIGVAAEIGIDLDGIAPDSEQDLECGVLVGSREHRVDDVGRQVRRKDHLLRQAGGDEPERFHIVDVFRVTHRADLREEFGAAHDGSGDEVREERQIDGDVDSPGRTEHPTVDVDHIADGHECEEGDPDRECQRQQGDRSTEAERVGDVVHVDGDEPEVLEPDQQTQQEGERDPERHAPPGPRCWVDQGTADEGDTGRRGEEEDEPPVPPGVEDVAGQHHECLPWPRVGDEEPLHREDHGEEDGEVNGGKEHGYFVRNRDGCQVPPAGGTRAHATPCASSGR